MSEIQYITWDELLHVYEKTVDESGGGFSGIRDRERLESVLEFVQNDLYYPTFEGSARFCVGNALLPLPPPLTGAGGEEELPL